MPVYANEMYSVVYQLRDKYSNAQAGFLAALTSYANTVRTGESTKGATRDLQRRKGAADQLFFDAQKQHGDVGVGRQQTLQEVVITFFLFSLVFFGIALPFYSFVTTHSLGSALKTLGVYLFSLFILFGFLLRYA